MVWRILLCACFFFAFFHATVALKGLHEEHKNGSSAHHNSSGTNAGPSYPEKPKRLFSRTHYLSQQRLQVPKPKPKVPAPGRRCVRYMGSCSAQSQCCDPCAHCHCRRFNTICQCWRLGSCTKKHRTTSTQ